MNIYAKKLPHLKKVRQLMLLFEQTTDDVCFHAFKDYYFCYGFVAQSLVFILLCCDGFPAEGCDDAANKWSYDEYPKFRESLATFEESRTDRTGWVDRGASEVDAYEMDENQ